MPQATVDLPELSMVRKVTEEWMDRREEDLDAQEFVCKVITIINGKGGVGKTSFAVEWAVFFVGVGQKVLYVELDPQGNACEDLGINGTPLDDDGRGQADSVLSQKPFQPTGEARPNLSIVPGGQELSRLVTEMH